MSALINNLGAMGVNLTLALLPVLFAVIALKNYKKTWSIFFFVAWFLFFPNTIYVITDLQYLPAQISQTNVSFDLLLIAQYIIFIIIGMMAYLYTMKAMVKKFKITDELVLVFNFLIAFAASLGKFQRTESWQIITNPIKVISDINKSISTPLTLLFVIGFGVLINFIWFLGKDYVEDQLFHREK